MLNKVVLIGRLTRDPEIRHIPTGAAVTTFTLAVNRNFTNQQGEREADFIPIVVWRGLAETCARYLARADWWPFTVVFKPAVMRGWSKALYNGSGWRRSGVPGS